MTVKRGFVFNAMTPAILFVYRHSGTFFVIWFLVIFLLCATPGEYIPSNNWLDLLSVDKLVHAGIFCVLTSLAILFWHKKQKPNLFIYLSLFGCVLYGVSLELMQASLFRNRSADWKDVIANTIGCLMALWLINKLKSKLLTYR